VARDFGSRRGVPCNKLDVPTTDRKPVAGSQQSVLLRRANARIPTRAFQSGPLKIRREFAESGTTGMKLTASAVVFWQQPPSMRNAFGL
jgi:hypothetical protein